MNKSPNLPFYEEREVLYRSIFDVANDGIIIIDVETGGVVEANPAAYKMHGYTYEGFIGLELAAFIHPDSQPVFSENIRAFQSTSVFDTRALHVRRGAELFLPNGG